MRSRFAGQVALVTGAASGIGRSVAQTLADEGASVLAVDRDHDALQSMRTGGEGVLSPFVCDVAEAGAAARAVTEATALGRLSLLVNAAGVMDRQDFFSADDDTWDRLLSVNVRGYVSFTREAALRMRRGGEGGRIVVIASITGHVSSPLVTYSTTKAAVLGFVRSVAPALADHQIRINSVSPGVTHTGMNDARLADRISRERDLARIPLGRIGEPADIAAAALFLLSDDAAYVTGADLVVDGGFGHWQG